MSIPKYTVCKGKRKSIRIVFHPNGTLTVYCPSTCTKKYLDGVVEKHYEKMKARHNRNSEALFGDTSAITLPFFGIRYPIIYNNESKFFFDGVNFSSPTSEKENIRALYREFLRKETSICVSKLAEEIASFHGFDFGKICVKAIYSRYGSCSSKKNLNFTLALAAYDTDFIRFVVSHELCHTVYMNHGADFYRLLDKVCPNHRKIKAENSKNRSAMLKSIFFNPAP